MIRDGTVKSGMDAVPSRGCSVYAANHQPRTPVKVAKGMLVIGVVLCVFGAGFYYMHNQQQLAEWRDDCTTVGGQMVGKIGTGRDRSRYSDYGFSAAGADTMGAHRCFVTVYRTDANPVPNHGVFLLRQETHDAAVVRRLPR